MDWHWWTENPLRFVLGIFLLLAVLALALYIIAKVLFPLLAEALLPILLVLIIWFAVTGRIGFRRGGH